MVPEGTATMTTSASPKTGWETRPWQQPAVLPVSPQPGSLFLGPSPQPDVQTHTRRDDRQRGAPASSSGYAYDSHVYL